MADRMLQQMLDMFMREFMRELSPGTPAPDVAPGPEATPAPNGTDDPTAEGIERLLDGLLDDLLQGLSPDGLSDPFAPDAGTDGQGA
jgi:hypothetical protein